MVADQGEERTRERCLVCMTWHEPGKHAAAKKQFPETLTGQVPAPEVTVDDIDFSGS